MKPKILKLNVIFKVVNNNGGTKIVKDFIYFLCIIIETFLLNLFLNLFRVLYLPCSLEFSLDNVTLSNSYNYLVTDIVMESNVYKCSICNQSFSRRWNASRHNKLIHGDLATILNNKMQPKQFFSKSQNKFQKYMKKFEKFNIFDEIYGNDWDIFTMNPESEKIMKIIGQLIVPFEELEKLTSRFDEDIRAFILYHSFKSCLKSYNPVKSLGEMAEVYRSLEGRQKISSYVSKSTGMPIEEAKSVIDAEIKGASIFKRQNN